MSSSDNPIPIKINKPINSNMDNQVISLYLIVMNKQQEYIPFQFKLLDYIRLYSMITGFKSPIQMYSTLTQSIKRSVSLSGLSSLVHNSEQI